MGSLTRSAALLSSALFALPLAASAQSLDAAPAVESQPTNSTPAPARPPSPALDPDARFTLRYSVPVDVTITAVGAVGWVVPELLKRPLTGPSCRWCERAPDGTRTVNALDSAVRDGLRWSNDRGRDGPSSMKTRAAPRTDPSERDYRTRLLPRVRSSKRSHGNGCEILAGGIQRFAHRSIRSQVTRRRWLRRRSACNHERVSR